MCLILSQLLQLSPTFTKLQLYWPPFLEHIKVVLAFGPLHRVFLLLGMLFFLIFWWLAPTCHLGLSSVVTSSERPCPAMQCEIARPTLPPYFSPSYHPIFFSTDLIVFILCLKLCYSFMSLLIVCLFFNTEQRPHL